VATVEYTTLGETGIEVSRICFGSWQFGGEWSRLQEREARAAVRRARELGINFFDTAQAYGFGRSEELLAEALGDDLEEDRDELVLATKGGLRPTGDGGVVRDSSEAWLRQGLEESLEHLGVDHVDVYQVHWPDLETPFEDVAKTLESFKEEGLVRAAGVSNYDADQMAAYERGGDLDTIQPPYHVLRRDAEA
jgi:aryl-alcohol dehydrogenase-like predicted oxidoreductase